MVAVVIPVGLTTATRELAPITSHKRWCQRGRGATLGSLALVGRKRSEPVVGVTVRIGRWSGPIDWSVAWLVQEVVSSH